MTRFEVYGDGSSCGAAGGPIGWGWVVLKDGAVLYSGCGGFEEGTNNQAEAMAVIDGLRTLFQCPEYLDAKEKTVLVVSDSQYVCGLGNGTSAPATNKELAKLLRILCVYGDVTCKWVRGHNGEPVNEICDKLAKYGKELHTEPTKLAIQKAKKAKKKRARKQRRRENRNRMKTLGEAEGQPKPWWMA